MSSILPIQGFYPTAPRTEKLLLLCWYDPFGISTVPETVACMQRMSRFPVTVLNLFEHRYTSGPLALHPSVNLDAFSGIVIHNSGCYNVDNLCWIDKHTARKLKDYRGIKVMMKQDENHRFREMAECIGTTGIDLIFTCLGKESLPIIYPPEVAGTPRFERMLTGYVTPSLRAIDPNSTARPIDIGYRGSIQPLSFGRLAFEKRKIGDDVERLLAGKGLALDISSRWETRFSGVAWIEFLKSCKVTLGAESGASVFDVDGDLQERCVRAEKKLGPLRDDHAYAEAYLAELADLEDRIPYGQISPRHFEAIATGTVQLLYPGEYSDILKAGRHYFPLARDYSNLDEAVDLIRDDKRRRHMADTAYEEVIRNKDYWIEQFVARFDTLVEEALATKGLLVKPAKTIASAHHVLMVAAHEPCVDPRLAWIEACAPPGMQIHQLGVFSEATGYRRYAKDGAMVAAYPRMRWDAGMYERWMAMVNGDAAGMAALHELKLFEWALALPESRFAAFFGAPVGNARMADFRWYLQFYLDITATLVTHALALRGLQALIATDLHAVPAALILKSIFGIPVFFDSHEYAPEADVLGLEFETQFWVGCERRLVAHLDYCQTVSRGLAELMTEQYGKHFETVPNCEPLDRALPLPAQPRRNSKKCQFLFLGNFAPRRGIDLLIQTWAETNPRAILVLQGPDNPYRQQMQKLAVATGLLGTRILFPDAVKEDQLIQTAAEADVGLIPYTPAGANYNNCSPNKLSQYMAAGIPVLANNTSFVAQILAEAECGRAVSFARKNALIDAVAEFTNDAALRVRLGHAGHHYFKTRFHWEIASAPLYKALTNSTESRKPELLLLFALSAWKKSTEEANMPPPEAPSQENRAPADSVLQEETQPEEALAREEEPYAPVSRPPYSVAAVKISALRALSKLWERCPPRVRMFLKPFARRALLGEIK